MYGYMYSSSTPVLAGFALIAPFNALLMRFYLQRERLCISVAPGFFPPEKQL